MNEQIDEAEFWDERIRVALNLQDNKGTFAKHLGEALMCADGKNSVRIKNAFPELWEENQ